MMTSTHDSSIGRNAWFLVLAASVSSLGGFLFGYDNIVISGAIGYLTKSFHLDAAGTGWAAGCALVGCLAGSAASGWLADRIGLKKSLAICAACFAGSSIGVFFSYSLDQFVLWRILGGVGIGAASILAPMYIAEIAPTRMRGRLVTLYQLGIVVGILGAVLVNMLIQRGGTEQWNLAVGWKWMFLAGAAPAVLFALAIAAALESPRWLLKAGRTNQGIAVLTKINGEAVARQESASIHEALDAEEGRFSELFTSGFGRALFLGVVLAGLTQTSGITPVFSYLPSIFQAAGAKASDSFFQSVLVGAINVAFTLVALWLVDKAGRRALLLCGIGLQALALSAVGVFYFLGGWPIPTLIGIMLFVAGHAFGNGVICWVILSEIFPTKVRGRAMSIATTSLWVFAFLGNLLFPIMQKSLGNSGSFWVFAFMAVVDFFFVLYLVPETKGQSLESIEKIFIKKPVLVATPASIQPPPMRIEQYDHSDPGYKPILVCEGWQIGHLNFAPELHAEAIDRVECHRQTDEVFILFQGGASLIEARETSAGLEWEVVRMRPGVTYNVPAALWHTISMLPGDLVLIVEKDGTHLNDVEYRSLTKLEQNSLQQAMSMKRN